MTAKKSDWLYLGAGVLSTWWLTKMQNGKNPNLEILRNMLQVVRWLERRLYIMDIAIMAEIDRELDSWGSN